MIIDHPFHYCHYHHQVHLSQFVAANVWWTYQHHWTFPKLRFEYYKI